MVGLYNLETFVALDFLHGHYPGNCTLKHCARKLLVRIQSTKIGSEKLLFTLPWTRAGLCAHGVNCHFSMQHSPGAVIQELLQSFVFLKRKTPPIGSFKKSIFLISRSCHCTFPIVPQVMAKLCLVDTQCFSFHSRPAWLHFLEALGGWPNIYFVFLFCSCRCARIWVFGKGPFLKGLLSSGTVKGGGK